MQQDTVTWESQDLRCPVCLCIFDVQEKSQDEPMVICSNMHTICKSCCVQNYSRDLPCPQCRTPCIAQDDIRPNRFVVNFLEKMRVRCGMCTSDVLMNNQEARAHLLQCPYNKIVCPFPQANDSACLCRQLCNVTSLFEHCRSQHCKSTTFVECSVQDNLHSALVSLPMACESVQNFAVNCSSGDLVFNVCIHVWRVQDDDRKDMLCVAVRRFFSDHAARLHRCLLSLEVGEISGLVLPLQNSLSLHEPLNVQDFDQLDAVIRLPYTLLRQMGAGCKSPVNIILTMQLDFESAAQ